jgi:hypothetical protein
MAKTPCNKTPSLFNFDELEAPKLAVDSWERKEGTRIFAADYGANGGKFCLVRDDNPENIRYINATDLIKLKDFAKGDCLVIEHAHLQPRNKRVSLAQPLTYEQLVQLYTNAIANGIDIREFPETLPYKYRNALFGEDSKKSDENDAQAILYAALQRNPTSLKKFVPIQSKTFSPIQTWAHEQINEMNDLLNKYRIEHNLEDPMCLVAFKQCLLTIDQISLQKSGQAAYDARRWFLGENLKEGAKTSGALSIWVTLFNWHGQQRLFQGKWIGINDTMRYLLGCKPHHFRGGVARSNIWYWNFRKALTDFDLQGDVVHDHKNPNFIKFKLAKSRYRKAIKETIKIMIEAFDKKMGAC